MVDPTENGRVSKRRPARANSDAEVTRSSDGNEGNAASASTGTNPTDDERRLNGASFAGDNDARFPSTDLVALLNQPPDVGCAIRCRAVQQCADRLVASYPATGDERPLTTSHSMIRRKPTDIASLSERERPLRVRRGKWPPPPQYELLGTECLSTRPSFGLCSSLSRWASRRRFPATDSNLPHDGARLIVDSVGGSRFARARLTKASFSASAIAPTTAAIVSCAK